MTIWKRVLSMILVLCMVSAVLPWTAVPAEAAGGYAVTDITVSRSAAAVSLTASRDCLLIVALYTEEGAMISTAMKDIEGKSGNQTVSVPVDPKGHGAFEAKAFLLDSKTYAPLGESRSADYEGWGSDEGFRDPSPQTVSYDQSQNIYYVNDTILVFFALGTSEKQIQSVADDMGGQIIGRNDLLNLFQIQVETSTLAVLRNLADWLTDEYTCISLATFDKAYTDYLSNAGTVSPNDPWKGDVTASDWKDTDVDGSNWWIEAVEGQKAWAYEDEFTAIKVGVVDSSFDIGHEDLKNQYTFASEAAEKRNDTTPWWTDWNSDTNDPASQKSGHGTHVAGIIAAEGNNNKGITGLAQNAELILSPCASTSDSVVYEAISQAVRAGAKVVNLSQGVSHFLGSGTFAWNDAYIKESAAGAAETMAVLLNQGYDFIVVQSAGNGNSRTNAVPVDALQNQWFCSVTEDTPVSGDGVTIQDVLDRIIIVGNATRNGTRYQCAADSNYGAQVDIFAPGTDIYSTLPGNLGTGFEFTGGYAAMDGTSMAAPVVTAVTAMTWSARRDLTGAEIRHIVCGSATKNVSPDPSSGDTRSYPLVNARVAVETALQYTRETTSAEKQTYPVTVKVRYEDGTPASKVLIGGTGLEEDPMTNLDGSAVFFLEEGNYRITANPTGWFDQKVLNIHERTTIELTLKEVFFDEPILEGTHLILNGWGPMPNYGSSSSKAAPWGKNITSAEIHGLATIGEYAFYKCTALTEVEMDDTVAVIGKDAFFNCTSLAEVSLSKNLFSLGIEVFYGCGDLDVPALPEMVTEIGNYAFYNCDAITNVTIPAGVTSFGEYVFGECTNLTKAIFLQKDAQISKRTFYKCENLLSFSAPNGISTVGYQAFLNCGKLETIPSLAGATAIGESAFKECKSLVIVDIPASVLSVGASAFEGCTSLEKVTLAEGVTTVGGSAFSNCKALRSITIPSTVTSLGSAAFMGCTALAEADILGGITTLSSSIFSGCTSLADVTLPDSLTWVEANVFKNCTALKELILPEGIQTIKNYAFQNCTSLREITIPNSVISAGSYTFQGCTGLKAATLSAAMSAVGDYMFDGCSGLLGVTIPDQITSIGNRAFQNCSSLLRVDFPPGLTEIETYAFAGCKNLLSADLPEGLSYIDSSAFRGCEDMTSVTLPETVTVIGSYAFYECKSLQKVVIPGGAILRDSAFEYCDSLSEVTLRPDVTYIPAWCFAYCDSLAKVNIPASVTGISSSAFNGCINLSVVNYGGTKDEWDEIKNGAFGLLVIVNYNVQ